MASPPPRSRWVRLIVGFTVLACLGVGGWYAIARAKSLLPESHSSADAPKTTPVAVEVVTPQPGGLARVCVQPGTIEPYAAADLYAKASGFLLEQQIEVNGVKEDVDIGTRVKKGDILARLWVPEYEKQVDRDDARVKAATAKIHQMEANLAAAEAETKAVLAAVAFAKVSVRAKTSYRKYREKQLARIKELVEQKALEGRLLDEQEDFYLSAVEAENAAKESVNTAEERAVAAASKITQAKADLEEAIASSRVAAAELAKSKVLLDYTVIRSPYNGVVTKRNFDVGEFIKSADQTGALPLLVVERTDVMRVIVQVPDRDIPFISMKATASVEIDSLPGVIFDTNGKTKLRLARSAKAEDPTTRTMRVEIDLKNPVDEDNPFGVLQHGMYGKVTLRLREGNPTAVRVPSLAVVGREGRGKGSVRVVRGEQIQTIPVSLGADNGVEVEILGGLTPTDQVVLRTLSPVNDGAMVAISGSKSLSAGH
jgi:RND family efflux transporter MFP subunit